MFKQYILIALSLLSFSMNAESSVMIALKQKNADVIFNALQDVSDPKSPKYGHYWTQDQIDIIVSPDKGDVLSLMDYLESDGISCEMMSGALKCSDMPDMKNLEFFTNIVEFVEEPLHIFKCHRHLGDSNGFVGREVINKLYNIKNESLKTRPSVCSVEYQSAGDFSQADLIMQENLNGEPNNTIAPNHIINVQSTYPFIEGQLDVQMMAQTAMDSDVWYWVDNSWLYSFAVNFQSAKQVPDVLSMSWGWSEADQCSITVCNNVTSAEYVKRVNLEYAKMGLRGISITVASGDAGAPGRTNEECMTGNVHPVFPGSSPYVTSVSATYLVSSGQPQTWHTPLCVENDCVAGTQELPTNYNSTGWTTGGGFGIYSETQPKWQADAVNHYLKSGVPLPKSFNANGRGYPDVSALGHNCPVVSGGSLIPVDGTSCSSPLFAGILAILNDHQVTNNKPKLGFVNPVLYQMEQDNPKIFKDITQGNNYCTEAQCCSNTNYGYVATKGWDPVTGLGTPNVGLMKEWLDKNT